MEKDDGRPHAVIKNTLLLVIMAAVIFNIAITNSLAVNYLAHTDTFHFRRNIIFKAIVLHKNITQVQSLFC